MLVTRILLELDAQLERLQTARNTIASLVASAPAKARRTSRKQALQTAPGPDAAETGSPVTLPAAQEPSVEATPVTAKRRGRPPGSVNRSGATRTRAPRPTEPTALAHVVEAGPVFVSAAELERRRARTFVMTPPKAVETPSAEGTLDALIREVAERRTVTAA